MIKSSSISPSAVPAGRRSASSASSNKPSHAASPRANADRNARSPRSAGDARNTPLNLAYVDAALGQIKAGTAGASATTPVWHAQHAAPPPPADAGVASAVAAARVADGIVAACRDGNTIALVRLCSTAGANFDPNACNRAGEPALLVAVRSGSLACVELLLAKRADVNAADPDGNTALHVAALTANMAILAKLCMRPDIELAPRLRTGRHQTPRELALQNNVTTSAVYLAQMEQQRATAPRR